MAMAMATTTKKSTVFIWIEEKNDSVIQHNISPNKTSNRLFTKLD